jgi:hypothetical protein
MDRMFDNQTDRLAFKFPQCPNAFRPAVGSDRFWMMSVGAEETPITVTRSDQGRISPDDA